MKDPYCTLEFAERLGLGTRNYELTEVLSPDETKAWEQVTQEYEQEPSFF